MSLRSVDVALTVVDGDFGGRRSLTLALNAACLLFDPGPRGRGTVADPKRGFVEFPLAEADCLELCRAAGEAGFEERLPDVREVADTSDRCLRATLVVSHEKGTRTLVLNLMHSGYEGPDAPALRRFFSLLLRAAGVADEQLLRDLTGS